MRRYTLPMTLQLGSEQIPLERDEDGTIRVASTRVTLESVTYAFQEGESAESIQEAFPALSLSDVYLVLGYCLRHPQELEAYLSEQQRNNAQAREQDEERFQQYGLKARLLQRRAQRGPAQLLRETASSGSAA